MSGSATGSSPNWVAGYVPPAGEWNQWWARKMDADNTIFAGGPFLSTQGGTMSGALYLPPANPVDPNEAVRKGYVDSLTFAAGPFMPTTGGIFTGPVTFTSSLELAGNPVNPLDAAPKQYVDSAINQSNNAINVANAAVRRAGDTMTGLLALSSDPVSPNHAATKAYADLRVLKSGDTMTGRLTVNSDMVVGVGPLYNSGNLYINAYNSWEWALTLDPNTGDHYQTYRTSWYDVWASATGTRSWVGGNQSLMNLNGGGNLNVMAQIGSGSMVTTTLSVGGNANVAGNHSVGSFSIGPWMFYNNGTAQIQQHTGGWYESWANSGGGRLWVNDNKIVMNLDPGGSLSVVGNITGTQIFSNHSVLAADGFHAGSFTGAACYFGVSGGMRVTQYQPNWYWRWDPNNGDLWWVMDNGGVRPFFKFRQSDVMALNDVGAIGAHGFQDFSDERGKTDINPATRGLADVLRINPITFVRVGKSRQELGFSAQQIRTVIPEAVSPMGIVLADGTGGIDDDEPSLGIQTTPIIAAMVNAMKELAADVAALKAGR
jgi:hypothetical protein